MYPSKGDHSSNDAATSLSTPLLHDDDATAATTTTTPSCLLEDLTPECLSCVFPFLSLKECLGFTSTGRKSLQTMLPELQRRRRFQFLHRYEVQYAGVAFDNRVCGKGKRLVVPDAAAAAANRTTAEVSAAYDEETSNIFTHDIRPAMIGPDQNVWCLVPSVQERLAELYRALPVDHPSNANLRDLVRDLAQADTGRLVVYGGDNTTTNSYQTLLGRLRAATKAHKLHATLLSNCTIKVDPQPFAQSIYVTNNDTPGTEFTTSLGQFLGDVLLSANLMAHSYSMEQTVEGGPSLRQWIDHIKSMGPGDGQGKQCYQLFLFLFEYLLRVIPKPIEEMRNLGMIPAGKLIGYYRSEFSDYQNWIAPFSFNAHPMDEDIRRSYCLDRMDGDCGIMMKISYNEFGPLGPAFRGRDRIRNVYVGEDALLNESLRVISVLGASRDSLEDCPIGALPIITEMASEYRKNRPMTVLPPTATFMCSVRLEE